VAGWESDAPVFGDGAEVGPALVERAPAHGFDGDTTEHARPAPLSAAVALTTGAYPAARYASASTGD